MRSFLRVFALAIFLGLLAAVPANAGQIVYSSNDNLVVANDDGSGAQTLLTPGQVPGAESLYNPHVDPSGTKVVFSARTPFVGGIFCGFNCVGVYMLDGDELTRVSGAPIGCAGDPCLGLNVDPKITADGGRVYYQRIYGEPGGTYGTPQTISHSYVAPTVDNGASQETELSQQAVGAHCTRPTNFVPNPANQDETAWVDCWPKNYQDPNEPSSALKVGGQTIGGDDDYEISGIAWRPDGQQLVTVEDLEDKGIWLYNRDGSGTPRHVLSVSDWGDNHQSTLSPTFIGGDKLAFYWNGEIRTIATSCDKCTVDQTSPLLASPDGDGLAWTARAVPVPGQGGGSGNGGGGNNNSGGGSMMMGGGGFEAFAPAKIKLATALRGLKIPFKAPSAGKLSLKATIDAKTAKKYKLGRKTVTVASGKAAPAGAVESTVKLKFTKAAVKRLKKAKSLKLKIGGTWTPAGGSAMKLSGSLTLRR